MRAHQHAMTCAHINMRVTCAEINTLTVAKLMCVSHFVCCVAGQGGGARPSSQGRCPGACLRPRLEEAHHGAAHEDSIWSLEPSAEEGYHAFLPHMGPQTWAPCARLRHCVQGGYHGAAHVECTLSLSVWRRGTMRHCCRPHVCVCVCVCLCVPAGGRMCTCMFL